MILRTVQRELRRANDDDAVSPVVGTILMVAITVLMGATVYTAVNGFGEESTSPPPGMVFKVQRLDTDTNGRFDAFKVTYITGPEGIANSDVVVTTTPANSTTPSPPAMTDSRGAGALDWAPGDFIVYDGLADVWFVTVSALGVTVVDQNVELEE